MKIEFTCAVEQGRRSYNDDRAMICGNVVNCGSDCACGTMPEMAAVCDGCGGHSGGYVAAQLVLETLARQNCAELLDETALSAALHQAEKRIVEAKEMSPQFGQHDWLLVFLLALLPLPLFDVVGVYSGGKRMNLWLFLFVCFLGKFLKTLLYTRAYDVIDWVTSDMFGQLR